MRLHVLGCSGGWPGANGATSGYLIEHEGHTILMVEPGRAFGGAAFPSPF